MGAVALQRQADWTARVSEEGKQNGRQLAYLPRRACDSTVLCLILEQGRGGAKREKKTTRVVVGAESEKGVRRRGRRPN